MLNLSPFDFIWLKGIALGPYMMKYSFIEAYAEIKLYIIIDCTAEELNFIEEDKILYTTRKKVFVSWTIISLGS
jgi:hypothetical protein